MTHEPFHPLEFSNEQLTSSFTVEGTVTPNQLRWKPFPVPSEPVDFVRGKEQRHLPPLYASRGGWYGGSRDATIGIQTVRMERAESLPP